MNQIPVGKNQTGLSLVELMIALLISTLILAGLVQVFTMNRATYQSDEGLARLQENARFAMEFLTREIRNAGNYGCYGLRRPPSASTAGQGAKRFDTVSYYVAGPATYIYNKPVPDIFNIYVPVQGYDATAVSNGTTYNLPALYPPVVTAGTAPAMPGSLNPAGIVVGSDVLVLRGMDQDSTPLVAPFNDPNQVNVRTPHSINVGQVVVAADCGRAHVFQVTGIAPGAGFDGLLHDLGGNPGNTCGTWTGTPPCSAPEFQDGGDVGALRNVVYYVGVGTGGGPALFRDNYISGSLVTEELVEGIENLQLHFGEFALHTGTIQYAEARSVTDWTSIRSIRIGMLVATSNVVTGQDTTPGYTSGATESALDTSQYQMSNITLIPPPDRRRRRAFETTVMMRNPT